MNRNDRVADLQYRELLSRVKQSGVAVMPQQEEEALMIFGHQMRFDLNNGFPLITERDLVSNRNFVFDGGISELAAFLNGARTQEELASYGCTWWKRWVTPEKCAKRGLKTGDLGPGSYGAAWKSFPTIEGKPFDQISHLVEQLNELPHLRTHFVSPWIPQYTGRGKGKQQKVVVVPCHGWFHVFVNVTTGELSLHHFQRSADVPVGLVSNIIQYAALTMMLAQVTGYRPKELVYTVSDAHIYLSQMKDVDDMLATTPQIFPTIEIDPSVKDIFSFRKDHFQVHDYRPQLGRRTIWTPV